MAELKDGEYMIDVALTGGSGKATITSPTKLNVNDGEMTAEIEWSSPHYDYMEISGESYTPVNKKGNSQFVVTVPSLDEEIPIKAETTAMSEPHMIDYSLYFYSSTAKAPLVLSRTLEGVAAGIFGVLLIGAIIAKLVDKYVIKK